MRQHAASFSGTRGFPFCPQRFYHAKLDSSSAFHSTGIYARAELRPARTTLSAHQPPAPTSGKRPPRVGALRGDCGLRPLRRTGPLGVPVDPASEVHHPSEDGEEADRAQDEGVVLGLEEDVEIAVEAGEDRPEEEGATPAAQDRPGIAGDEGSVMSDPTIPSGIKRRRTSPPMARSFHIGEFLHLRPRSKPVSNIGLPSRFREADRSALP